MAQTQLLIVPTIAIYIAASGAKNGAVVGMATAGPVRVLRSHALEVVLLGPLVVQVFGNRPPQEYQHQDGARNRPHGYEHCTRQRTSPEYVRVIFSRWRHYVGHICGQRAGGYSQ